MAQALDYHYTMMVEETVYGVFTKANPERIPDMLSGLETLLRNRNESSSSDTINRALKPIRELFADDEDLVVYGVRREQKEAFFSLVQSVCSTALATFSSRSPQSIPTRTPDENPEARRRLEALRASEVAPENRCLELDEDRISAGRLTYQLELPQQRYERFLADAAQWYRNIHTTPNGIDIYLLIMTHPSVFIPFLASGIALRDIFALPKSALETLVEEPFTGYVLRLAGISLSLISAFDDEEKQTLVIQHSQTLYEIRKEHRYPVSELLMLPLDLWQQFSSTALLLKVGFSPIVLAMLSASQRRQLIENATAAAHLVITAKVAPNSVWNLSRETIDWYSERSEKLRVLVTHDPRLFPVIHRLDEESKQLLLDNAEGVVAFSHLGVKIHSLIEADREKLIHALANHTRVVTIMREHRVKLIHLFQLQQACFREVINHSEHFARLRNIPPRHYPSIKLEELRTLLRTPERSETVQRPRKRPRS